MESNELFPNYWEQRKKKKERSLKAKTQLVSKCKASGKSGQAGIPEPCPSWQGASLLIFFEDDVITASANLKQLVYAEGRYNPTALDTFQSGIRPHPTLVWKQRCGKAPVEILTNIVNLIVLVSNSHDSLL